MRGRKPKIGDIFEVRVPSGLAYVQYTHDAADGTQLVRVLPGIHPSRPHDLVALAKQQELYFTFLILGHALRTKQIEMVSNQSIPEWARHFPTMRKPGAWSNQQARALNWYIGHGLRLYTIQEMQQALNVRELTPEQTKLSIASIWSPSLLIERIEQGWTPERDQELAAAARKTKQEYATHTATAEEAKARFIDHYLYFPKKSDAQRAAERLRTRGWTVEVKMGADGKNWLALAKQPVPVSEDIGDIRDELEQLADEFYGEYDGWGAAVE